MSDNDIFNRPGIVIVSHADYDGWAKGIPVKYVGPFPNWDAYRGWVKQEYGLGSGWHFKWQVLESPGDHIIEEE